MTVLVTTAQSGPFTPNGVTTSFPFTFAAASASEVQVVRRPTVGSDVVLTGFTVQLNADGTGTAKFITAPAAGDPIYVLSNPNFQQQVSFATQGSWSPTTMNKALDRAALRAIWLKNQVSTAQAAIASLLAGGGGGGGGTGDKGDPGGNVLAIGLFAVAATLSIPGGTNIIKTSGYSTDGKGSAEYVYDALVNGAYVTANPRTSFISTNARGFKLSADQRINVGMFGAVADDDGSAGTDNSVAFTSALAWRNALAIDNDGYVRGAGGIFLPAGRYYSSTAIDLSFGTILEGEGVPGHAPATQLRFPDGTSAFRIQYYVTSGETTTGVTPHAYGDHAIIRRIGIFGPLRNTETGISGGEAEWHGILAKAPFIIEDVYINGFRGDGVHCDDDTGAGTGNVNVSQVNRLRVTNVRNGMLFKSGDSNACTTIGVNGTYCRQHTIRDESFLGNTHIGSHSANANLVPGVPAAVVSYSGNRYYVKMGQAVGASTNAPTGTTFSNTWWGYISAGGVATSINIPAWTNGVSVREGGGFFANNPNARNTFIGAYQEGGEAISQFATPTLSLGGIDIPDSTGNVMAGDYVSLPNSPTLGQARVANGSTTRILSVHNNQVLASSIPVHVNFEQGLETDGVTPANLGSVYAYGNTNNPVTLEGVLAFATRTLGGTGGMTDRMFLDGPNATFRPAVDNNWNFGLTTFRWQTGYFYAVNALSSIGYGTGAGGAVTQATSKSTATPAINKACGQITMNAAALAGGAKVSFVVTNSTVAATDTPIVAVASGGTANAYRASVTAVASGSFTVTVENITGGSLSEAPVINFAVMKAVAA